MNKPKPKKSLAEIVWRFFSPGCSYNRTPGHHSFDGICPCTYFPKYVMKNGRSAYGKVYKELGDKVGKMCKCKQDAWWNKHTKNRTYKICPMMDFLKKHNGIKGADKNYKDCI